MRYELESYKKWQCRPYECFNLHFTASIIFNQLYLIYRDIHTTPMMMWNTITFLAIVSLSNGLVLPRQRHAYWNDMLNQYRVIISPFQAITSNGADIPSNRQADAEAAIAALIKKVSESVNTNSPLPSTACFYTKVSDTMVSFCNKEPAARIPTVKEDRAGLDAIIATCGATGNFNGARRTSDASFGIFGTTSPSFSFPPSNNNSSDDTTLASRAKPNEL